MTLFHDHSFNSTQIHGLGCRSGWLAVAVLAHHHRDNGLRHGPTVCVDDDTRHGCLRRTRTQGSAIILGDESASVACFVLDMATGHVRG